MGIGQNSVTCVIDTLDCEKDIIMSLDALAYQILL